MQYTVVKVQNPAWDAVPAVARTQTRWLTPGDIEATAQACHDGERLYVRMTA